jgi:predicted O-methyltransferase YrrM
MSIRSKLATLIWFAARPSFWAHALQLAGRKFKPDLDDLLLRSAAGKWAEERVVGEEVAYARLGISPPSDQDKRRLCQLLLEGEALAGASTVKMGGPGAIEFLFGCALGTDALNVVETGVAYGWSSLAFLAALNAAPSGRLVSVDMPYAKAGNEPWVGVCVPERLRAKWTLIRKPDRNGLVEALARLGGHGVDISHYDSDKSYWGRRWAYPRLWQSLRPGGLFISDDIQDNFYFREFSAQVGVEPVVIGYDGKFVGCLRKPA